MFRSKPLILIPILIALSIMTLAQSSDSEMIAIFQQHLKDQEKATKLLKDIRKISDETGTAFEVIAEACVLLLKLKYDPAKIPDCISISTDTAAAIEVRPIRRTILLTRMTETLGELAALGSNLDRSGIFRLEGLGLPVYDLLANGNPEQAEEWRFAVRTHRGLPADDVLRFIMEACKTRYGGTARKRLEAQSK